MGKVNRRRLLIYGSTGGRTRARSGGPVQGSQAHWLTVAVPNSPLAPWRGSAARQQQHHDGVGCEERAGPCHRRDAGTGAHVVCTRPPSPALPFALAVACMLLMRRVPARRVERS